ncbi:MAG: caspase family protein, partial [Paucibacter sp.]|nr:caspase family protein [Roseateles sp.]
MRPMTSSLVGLALISWGVLAQAQGLHEVQKDGQKEGQKLALVIGNSGYANARLDNPANDAHDLAVTLKSLGFEVIEKIDLNGAAFTQALKDFSRLQRKGGTAIFYYAGHGVQLNGANYLLPVGPEYHSEKDIEQQAISADLVMRSLEEGQGRVGIVILDACRNNPFASTLKSRSLARAGLARMDAPSGSLVAFSTAPGNVASDGTGRNGLYTKYLLINVKTPGLTLEQVFKRTREGVERESEGEQSPREESSLKGDEFYFIAPGAASPVSVASSHEAVELAFWDTIKDSRDAADFGAYLKEFPAGKFAPLAKAQAARLARGQGDKSRTGATPPASPITLMVGNALPVFEAQSLDGSKISDKVMSGRPATISFFFSKDRCRSCIASLAALKTVAARFGPDELMVVAFGKDSPAQLAELAQGAPANLHFVHADETLLKRFRISDILPTTILTGRGGEIVTIVAGGSASSEGMLLSLADSLQQGSGAAAAQTLYGVLASDPADLGGGSGSVHGAVARAGQGYALLHDGDAAGAKAVFEALAATDSREAAARGDEGLAEVLLAQGDLDGALRAANQALALFPNRAPAMLAKARILVATGRPDEAKTLVALAGGDQAVADFSWQRSAAAVAQGNLLRGQAPAQAVEAYQKARLDNPYAAEALGNQGVVLMESGQAQKAVELLQRGQALHPADPVVQSLLRQAQAALAQQSDLARQKYIDDTVAELVTRFREQKGRKPANPDDWTTPPMVVSILELRNNSGPELLGRVGMDKVFVQELSDQLQARHVSVVDRALLDKVMAELKLGSSELADPDTQLKLGRILAARLIVTGS